MPCVAMRTADWPFLSVRPKPEAETAFLMSPAPAPPPTAPMACCIMPLMLPLSMAPLACCIMPLMLPPPLSMPPLACCIMDLARGSLSKALAWLGGGSDPTARPWRWWWCCAGGGGLRRWRRWRRSCRFGAPVPRRGRPAEAVGVLGRGVRHVILKVVHGAARHAEAHRPFTLHGHSC